MRNIVEFGYGHYSTSFCQKGDRLLAAEPLLDLYEKHLEIYRPEGFSFFQLDKIAIAGHDGVCEIAFNPSELEHADTSDKSGFQQTQLVNCVTLDSWLARYSEQGFTARIDIMNCVLNGNTADPIFKSFSFNPRPEFIMIRQPHYPDTAIEKMKNQGYKIYACGGAVMGVRC